MNKVGTCVSLENARLALDAGFDYVELSASQLATSELELYEGLPVEATNLFFPHIDLYTSDEWRQYAEKLFEKASRLRVQVMVIGSGGVRKSRLDIPPAEAEERFAKIVAELQQMTDIRLAPESLNRSETDCYNSMQTLAVQAKDNGFGFTTDAYHILYEWNADGQSETLDQLFEREIPFKPDHVHLAALEGRKCPQPGDPQIEAFFQRLKTLGYTGRVSLECNGLTPDGYEAALANVQSFL